MKRENLKAFKGLLAFVLALLLALPAGLAFADELNDLEKNRVEDVDAGKACSLTLVLSYENDEGETVVVPDASVKLYKVADLTTAGGSATYALTSAYAGTGVVFEGMTASEIFHSDYKEYLAGEVAFGIGSVYTETEESLVELTEMIEAELPSIYASNSLNMLFCLVSTDETTWMVWYGEGAEAAVRDSFPEYDGSGRMVFIPKASRKENIVPPLTATLEKKD